MLLPTLNLPTKLGRWATDSNRTLEPPSGLKDTGWADNNKPPARMLNWLSNLAYQWHQRVGSTILANWEEVTVSSPYSFKGLTYSNFSGHKKFVAVGSIGSPFYSIYYSYDGITWGSSGGTLTASPTAGFGSVAANTTHYLVAKGNGTIDYSTSGSGSWTNEAIGGGGVAYRIATKYPDSDFTMVVQSNSSIRIGSTGIGSTWVAPTTPPSSPLAGEGGIVHTTGSTWFYQTYGASSSKLYTSINDGDTWTEVTTLLNKDTWVWRFLGYNVNENVLIVTGSDSSSKAVIAYSEDLGVTWNLADIDIKGDSDNDYVLAIPYYCGGSFWAIPISTPGLKPNILLLVSMDNGATWKEIGIDSVTSGYYLGAVSCNTERLLAIGGITGSGDDPFCVKSLKMAL